VNRQVFARHSRASRNTDRGQRLHQTLPAPLQHGRLLRHVRGTSKLGTRLKIDIDVAKLFSDATGIVPVIERVTASAPLLVRKQRHARHGIAHGMANMTLAKSDQIQRLSSAIDNRVGVSCHLGDAGRCRGAKVLRHAGIV
jgi:hypothetical protein